MGWLKEGRKDRGFYVANYSQPVSNEKVLKCHLWRSVNKKVLIMGLANAAKIYEGLIPTVLQLYEPAN